MCGCEPSRSPSLRCVPCPCAIRTLLCLSLLTPPALSLTGLDAAGNRILSVLDEALEGLKLLSLVVTCAKEEGDKMIPILGPSLADKVQRHLALELEYEQEYSAVRDPSDRMGRMDANGSDRTSQIKEAMKETGRAIYRELGVRPLPCLMWLLHDWMPQLPFRSPFAHLALHPPQLDRQTRSCAQD